MHPHHLYTNDTPRRIMHLAVIPGVHHGLPAMRAGMKSTEDLLHSQQFQFSAFQDGFASGVHIQLLEDDMRVTLHRPGGDEQ